MYTERGTNNMGVTSERNNQIVIELLKYHGIKKIVVSPGATNVSFVASIQNDSFFEIFSCVDERSAAYIACGIAAETGEPVALSCTGATASRNYYPGLTEAYYRHLPILAITSTMPLERLGHNIPQVIDRRNPVSDIVKLSVHVPLVKDAEDEWNCIIRANEAILELKHRIPGPVHMNVETAQSGTFDVETIKYVRPIDRITQEDKLPALSGKRIAIFCGAHMVWSQTLTDAVDRFCQKYGAVVIGDHTSNYKGVYGANAALVAMQEVEIPECSEMDVLIHIGDISGAYLKLHPKEVWRVSPDGRLCDTFKTLRYTFEFDEAAFFEAYSENGEITESNADYRNMWQNTYQVLLDAVPDVPFSNIWAARKLSASLPEHCVLHLGILNSLRSWNFFDIPKSVSVFCNTGGFGIDGCVSSLMGAALMAPDKLFFGVVGDLALFYDLNVLGNRHFPKNIRLLVINNGHGQEFRNYKHRAAQFGEDTDMFIAAAGHNGNKSSELLRGFATALGIQYYSAMNKPDFENALVPFVSEKETGASIILEIFTDHQDETEALREMLTLNGKRGTTAKDMVKKAIGERGTQALKNIFKRK